MGSDQTNKESEGSVTEFEVAALCDQVCERLRLCGFYQAYLSMKSEARYFKLDGYSGVIRVAYHRHKKGTHTINGNRVIAKITFNKKAPKYTERSIDQMMRFAIGTYILEAPLHV